MFVVELVLTVPEHQRRLPHATFPQQHRLKRVGLPARPCSRHRRRTVLEQSTEGPKQAARSSGLLMLTNRVGTEVLRSSHQLPSLEKQVKSRRSRLDSIGEGLWHRFGPGGFGWRLWRVRLAVLEGSAGGHFLRDVRCFLPN